jgi:hypothetical protein
MYFSVMLDPFLSGKIDFSPIFRFSHAKKTYIRSREGYREGESDIFLTQKLQNYGTLHENP